MSAVSAPAQLLGAINLDVVDVQVLRVEPFHLRIRLGVFQKPKDVPARFARPSALAVGAVLVLRLGRAPRLVAVAAERDAALALKNSLQVALRGVQPHAADGECRLPCRLEVASQVAALGLAGLLLVLRLMTVPVRHCALPSFPALQA